MDASKNTDAYIFRTSANALMDHARRSRVRRRIFEETVELTSDFSPERVLQGSQSLAQLGATLRTLPERTLDVFMLRCVERLEHPYGGRIIVVGRAAALAARIPSMASPDDILE